MFHVCNVINCIFCCSCLLAVVSYSHDVAVYTNSTGESWDKVGGVSVA